jgi:hypothetical protein
MQEVVMLFNLKVFITVLINIRVFNTGTAEHRDMLQKHGVSLN